MDAPNPRDALDRFLKTNDIAQREAGRQLRVSHVTIRAWIDGSRTPEPGPQREAIERWTNGAVLAVWWETDEERAKREALAAIEPFRPSATGTDGG
jgi:hypothetical protein